MPPKTKNAAPAVLITGSGTRIGRHMAEFLSSIGYDIAIHFHTSRKPARELATIIRSRQANCELFSCDLSDPSQASRLIRTVKKCFPRLCVLINNASVYKPSSLRKLKTADILSDFNVNLNAPLILTSEFAKMIHKGQIINILDSQIVRNKTSFATYLLMKKSLADLTKLAAVELAPGIRVNAIAPGIILPPVGKGPEYLSQLINRVPLQRNGSLQEITQSVEFLLKNDYLTGQIIFVDGGLNLI